MAPLGRGKRAPRVAATPALPCSRYQMWCQVTEKLPPLMLDGVAFVVLPDAIVMASRPARLPNSVPLAVEPEKLTVPKFDSGSTPLLLDGASAMTSADDSAALL